MARVPAKDGPCSDCPIHRTLEVVGDRWSLLIIRDLMFAGKRHFRELLASDEHIASNILADRLKKLVAYGVISKSEDPTHKQKAVYALTARGQALEPVLAQMEEWGTTQLGAPAKRRASPAKRRAR